MITHDREKFIENILSDNTCESSVAKRLHKLLQGCNSKFLETSINDFLENKELFDAARHEIYDILTNEHQTNFDMAEKILR